MKIHIEKEDIPELASRIPFEQLSEEEQQQIITILGSRELYTAMHYAIAKTKNMWQNEEKSNTKHTTAPQSLHRALQRKKSRSLLLKPIPLYQFSLAIAASIAIIFFMAQKNDTTTILPQSNPSETQKVVLNQQYNRDSLISIIADSIRKVLYNVEGDKHISGNEPHIRTIKYSKPITFSDKKEYTAAITNNPYGGLDNLPNVLAQNKGVTASESDAVDRFRYKQMSMR